MTKREDSVQILESPFRSGYEDPGDEPLDDRELDLLLRMDGPQPVESVCVSRSVHGLAIRAVREIQRARNNQLAALRSTGAPPRTVIEAEHQAILDVRRTLFHLDRAMENLK